MPDKLNGDLNAAGISSLRLMVLISEQTVTVGKGIELMYSDVLIDLNVTGSSIHRIQIL